MKKLLFLIFVTALFGTLKAQEEPVVFSVQITMEAVGTEYTVKEGDPGYTENLIIDLDKEKLTMGKVTCQILLTDLSEENDLVVLCNKLEDGSIVAVTLDMDTYEGSYILTVGDDIDKAHFKNFKIIGTL